VDAAGLVNGWNDYLMHSKSNFAKNERGFTGNVNQIIVLAFTIVIGIACMGDITAWAVYGIYRQTHREIIL
jgi:type IV secretory pathway VirB2 component (pilin)